MANVPPRVVELVETFEQHIEAYRSQQYNETQLRREFIDPFFEELGWDVTNKAGYAHAYKDVIHEDAIKVGSATKAPDYCFRIGGVRKFFLEAKKPSVDIQGDPHPAYQLRRYAWSAKLPLSVVTDFEEFAVYDCLTRPRHTDKADAARIMLLTYKDYLKKWPEIADIFSKEAVLKGSFDKFAAATKGKRGTSTVDKEFLGEIEKWRSMLARIIALRNRTLSVREINFSVQRIIDRILFLRMCEDRAIEPYGQLQAISSGERTYPRLCEVFEKADQRYNSGLFHFHDEPDRHEPPDQLTPNLVIDDTDLKWILHSLYYPQSPYEFSVLPAEILGNVYEQFLGKVITLTSGHRANVEDKPEVKKAGGVYYTPSYIVDYIVKNTVGRLLGDLVMPSAPVPSVVEGVEESVSNCHSRDSSCHSRASGNPPAGQRLTPKQVSNIKILDPACGSGSFLIGAYQYLLDWHLRYYGENDPEKHAKGREPKICQVNSTRHCEESFDETQDKPGDEVAGMAYATISNYRLTITEKKRILLSNIFGVDIDSQAVEVTKLSLLLKVLEGESSETIENQYRLFHERALPDLAANIKCGNSLIGPDFFDNIDSSCHSRENGNPDDLRDKINAFDWHAEFSEIFTRPNPGFDAVIGNPPWGATFSSNELKYLESAFITASNRSVDSYTLFIERALNRAREGGLVSYITPDTFLRKDDHQELRRCILANITVNELIETGPLFTQVPDTWCLVFSFSNTKPTQESTVAHKKISRFVVSARDRLRKFASSNWDIEDKIKQSTWSGSQRLIIGYRSSEVEQRIIRKIEEQATLAHLGDRFRISRGEEGSKFSIASSSRDGDFWMAIPADISRYYTSEGVSIRSDTLAPKKLLDFYSHPKIWIIRIQKLRWKQRLVTSLDIRNDSAAMKTLQVVVSTHENLHDLMFLQGILASSLINFWCTNYLADDMNKSYLERIPIPKCDPGLSKFVGTMLDLHQQLAAAKIPDEKTQIQRQIDATDKQIDQLVYALYGLTEEEIKIVEKRI